MKDFHLALVVLTADLLCVGNAVGKDDKKARSAAAVLFKEPLSKDADAMVRLGVMYANGKGVLEDDKEVVKWCRKAAELGETPMRRTIEPNHRQCISPQPKHN